VLCRDLKRTLLLWPMEKILPIFGQQVLEKWTQTCARVRYQMTALVARPLCTCIGRLAQLAGQNGMSVMPQLDWYWLGRDGNVLKFKGLPWTSGGAGAGVPIVREFSFMNPSGILHESLVNH